MKQNKIHFPLSFPELETERLFLKKIRLSDAYDLHTYYPMRKSENIWEYRLIQK